ncbi:MAG: hypothetical protein JO266_23165 [Acidobacteria bacterium]|nr:hypothetical protein [Acidobacteriota bacterium]
MSGLPLPDLNSPIGSERLKPIVPLRLAPPAGATIALLIAQGGPIRFTTDGSMPSITAGQLLPEGGAEIVSSDLTRVRVVQAVPSAICDVRYFSGATP